MTVDNSPAEHNSALAQRRNDVSLIRYSGRFAPSPTGPLHLDHSLLLLPAIAMQKPIKANGWFVSKIQISLVFIPAVKSIFLHHLKPSNSNPIQRSSFKNRLDIYESVLDQLKRRSYLCMSMYAKNAWFKCNLCRYLPRSQS